MEFIPEKYWKKQEDELNEILDNSQNDDKIYVYCIGDCLTLGIIGKGDIEKDNYPNQLQKLLGDGYVVVNLGRTMLRLENLLSFTNLFNKKITHDGILCIWAGTNDIYIKNSGEQVFEWFLSFCETLNGVKHKIITMTILPRSNATPIDFDDNRQVFNSLMLNNLDEVVDVGNNELIGFAGAENNTDYYDIINNAHLNKTGYGVVAEEIYNKIIVLLEKSELSN